MDIKYGFFAAKKYYGDYDKLNSIYNNMNEVLNCKDNSFLCYDDNDIDANGGDILVAIPMSGAVQSKILQYSSNYRTVIMFAAYIENNFDKNISSELLYNNSAPALMDCFSVLNKEHSCTFLAHDHKQLQDYIDVANAYCHFKGAKMLLIGDTEPWVISASHDIEAYRKFGLELEQISQQEILDKYYSASDSDALPYYNHFLSSATNRIEPTIVDVMSAAKMAYAITNTVEIHNADCIAIACFNLLKSGTNSCLGVSYVNDMTDRVIACEGDMDSAVTMLAMKHLTKSKLWMANPGLHPDGIVNFSHCTSCINVMNSSPCQYILRNHHESNIGVSLQVSLPVGKRITACRISCKYNKISINTGISIEGPYENACRTQMYVKFDDYDKYINNVLGCHQTFAFEDISDKMKLLGKKLGLEIV